MFDHKQIILPPENYYKFPQISTIFFYTTLLELCNKYNVNIASKISSNPEKNSNVYCWYIIYVIFIENIHLVSIDGISQIVLHIIYCRILLFLHIFL